MGNAQDFKAYLKFSLKIQIWIQFQYNYSGSDLPKQFQIRIHNTAKK
jgi:hypothetical protein